MSFPGRIISVIDVPEIKKFTLKFVYNFFLPNESSTNANSPQSIGPKAINLHKQYSKFKGKSTSNATNNLINDTLGKLIPRYIVLNFKPAFPAKTIDSKNLSLNVDNVFNKHADKKFHAGLDKIVIGKNKDIIHSEIEFSNGAFSVFNFQDTGLDGKMYFLASGSIANRLNAQNESQAKYISNKLKEVQASLGSKSHTDQAKVLNALTSKNVVPDFLMDALNNIETAGRKFVDDDGIQKTIDSTVDKFKYISLPVTINNKLIYKVLTSVKEDRLGMYHDELTTKIGNDTTPLRKAMDIQGAAHSAYDPNLISENDYQSMVEQVPKNQIAFDLNKIDLANFTGIKKLQGYEIKKFRIDLNGDRWPENTIYVEDPDTNYYVDAEVKYGHTYEYIIRTVFSFTVLVDNPNDNKGGLTLATVLVASKPIMNKIKCIEKIFPKPPINIKYFYDYEKDGLRLIWDIPTNPQRDIKRFQVFRRSSILDPFELIMEFNFDDKNPPKYSSGEAIDPSLYARVNDYVFTYLDRDFNKKSKYIYAMCSIDAHGMTSNYSIQTEVLFDKFKNVLVKKFISHAGAPKQYPNFVLQNTLVQNSIRDSNHSKLKVYFDPEYLNIVNNNDENLGLLATRDYGKYRLEFINIDLQKSTGIDIIMDSTTVRNNAELLDLDDLKNL